MKRHNIKNILKIKLPWQGKVILGVHTLATISFLLIAFSLLWDLLTISPTDFPDSETLPKGKHLQGYEAEKQLSEIFSIVYFGLFSLFFIFFLFLRKYRWSYLFVFFISFISVFLSEKTDLFFLIYFVVNLFVIYCSLYTSIFLYKKELKGLYLKLKKLL